MKTSVERDRQLGNAILRQLELDAQVTSEDINVAMTNRVVTLTAFVYSFHRGNLPANTSSF